jgi:hypothetical protein
VISLPFAITIRLSDREAQFFNVGRTQKETENLDSWIRFSRDLGRRSIDVSDLCDGVDK